MSDNVFRVIITIGVAASWVTTLVIAVAMLWIYRSSKRMEEKVALLLDKASPVLDSARSLVDDARPKIQEVFVRAAEITTLARDQMARLDALVTETSDSVRVQIERIDMVVGDAVERVQETTAAVQGTILKPVREVNGLISGVRAALSTLARGNRASVDHATQDEEMFI
jgi:ABC-type transporter Mla subunit MlaD